MTDSGNFVKAARTRSAPAAAGLFTQRNKKQWIARGAYAFFRGPLADRPFSSRSFRQYSRRLIISRSKPRSTGR
jgi:hypothetical protein